MPMPPEEAGVAVVLVAAAEAVPTVVAEAAPTVAAAELRRVETVAGSPRR